MLQTIIHTSENENTYLYEDRYRLSMLIHPELKKAHEAAAEADSYYKRKYAYLKSHGFFSEFTPPALGTTVSPAKVEESIIQTPQLLFEVTDACNLKCTYCALGELYEWGNNRNSKQINREAAFLLLKYLFDLKLRNRQKELVISFYGGEPLLNIPFIEQVIEWVGTLNAEKKISIGYNMTTNAILLDKHLDFLVANNFKILISLDGNEENNSYRISRKDNENSFPKVIANVDRMQRDYPQFFENNVNFNAVLHNKNSVKSIYEFIYNRYHKIPQVSELNNVGVNPAKDNLFKTMFHDVLESENEYYREEGNLLPHDSLASFHELSNFLKYLSVNAYVSDIPSALHTEQKYFPACTCFPFSKKIFLTTNGTLLPCEKIDYHFTLGKVDGSIELDTEEIARQYSSYYEHLSKRCQYCYLYRFCGICFFHIRDLDKLNNGKWGCDYFHNKNAFQAKLHHIFSFLETYPDDFFEILENVVIVS